MEAFGFSNVELFALRPDEVLPDMKKRAATAPVDIILLYAVLEHQTLEERLATLQESWEILVPGGLLVVVETQPAHVRRPAYVKTVIFFICCRSIQHVLGDLNAITVSDGYSPWLLRDSPENFEEHLLWQYMESKAVAIPKGFCRHYSM